VDPEEVHGIALRITLIERGSFAKPNQRPKQIPLVQQASAVDDLRARQALPALVGLLLADFCQPDVFCRQLFDRRKEADFTEIRVLR
jgi:hypothetical protein